MWVLFKVIFSRKNKSFVKVKPRMVEGLEFLIGFNVITKKLEIYIYKFRPCLK